MLHKQKHPALTSERRASLFTSNYTNIFSNARNRLALALSSEISACLSVSSILIN